MYVVVCVLSILLCILGYFFFCKHNTAYEMRISDWSSDVCSSDLKRCYHRVKSGDARVYRKFNLPPYGLADSTRGLTMLTTAGKIVDYFIPREARDEASNYMMFRTFVFLHLLGPLLGQSVIAFLYKASDEISWVFWVIEINLCSFWLMPLLGKNTLSLGWLATLSLPALVTLSLLASF